MINIAESNSIPKPPAEMGLLTYLGKYEIKVNNAQLLLFHIINILQGVIT